LLKLLVLFVHLLATCVAVGSILATDLRLLSRLGERGPRFAPPNAFVVKLVSCSLLVLYLSGAALVAWGLQERADYLNNPKLQAKLLLVALLTLNALALHLHTFPRLQRGRRLGLLSLRTAFGVALPIACSNALWLMCAFLGIARPLNFSVPALDVLAWACGAVTLAWCGVMAALAWATYLPSAPRVRVATGDAAALDDARSAAYQAQQALRKARASSRRLRREREARVSE
jgi:hypothetical protein